MFKQSLPNGIVKLSALKWENISNFNDLWRQELVQVAVNMITLIVSHSNTKKY